MSKVKALTKSGFDPKAFVRPGITEEQVKELKASFDLFDSDQGGSIDIAELKATMISLGYEAKNGAIFQMISDLDADGSGTIDFQEWFDLMTKKVNDKDKRENIRKVFALFDNERSGFISIANLRRVAQELGEDIGEQELQELVDRADTDFDGLISEEEFYTIVTRPIKQ